MFDEEGYSVCSLDHKGGQNSDASERTRPLSDRCIKGTTYASLSAYTFYDRLHDVFTLFLV